MRLEDMSAGNVFSYEGTMFIKDNSGDYVILNGDGAGSVCESVDDLMTTLLMENVDFEEIDLEL